MFKVGETVIYTGNDQKNNGRQFKIRSIVNIGALYLNVEPLQKLGITEDLYGFPASSAKLVNDSFSPSLTCICTTQDLMIKGCKCGHLKKDD